MHTSSFGAELEINFLEILFCSRVQTLAGRTEKQKDIDLHIFAEKEKKRNCASELLANFFSACNFPERRRFQATETSESTFPIARYNRTGKTNKTTNICPSKPPKTVLGSSENAKPDSAIQITTVTTRWPTNTNTILGSRTTSV